MRKKTQNTSVIESLWTEVDGRPVHARLVRSPYYDEGQLPVVLVPGLGLSSQVMLPAAKALSHAHPVYAIDPPGYGLSAKRDRVLSVREQAESLAGWMKAMEIDQAMVIANSVGCQAAAELALTASQRVQRLVLTGPTTDPSGKSLGRMIARWVRELPMEAPMLPIMLRDYWDCGPRQFFGYLSHTGLHDMEQVVPRLSMPVLFLRGEKDPIVTQPWVERLARLASFGRLIVVPKAAHNLTFLAPEAVSELVDEWARTDVETQSQAQAA